MGMSPEHRWWLSHFFFFFALSTKNFAKASQLGAECSSLAWLDRCYQGRNHFKQLSRSPDTMVAKKKVFFCAITAASQAHKWALQYAESDHLKSCTSVILAVFQTASYCSAPCTFSLNLTMCNRTINIYYFSVFCYSVFDFYLFSLHFLVSKKNPGKI